MRTSRLTGRFERPSFSSEGLQAEIVIVEPNGDAHTVRCLLRGAATEICGDTQNLTYLNDSYGAQCVCAVARNTTLSGFASPPPA